MKLSLLFIIATSLLISYSSCGRLRQTLESIRNLQKKEEAKPAKGKDAPTTPVAGGIKKGEEAIDANDAPETTKAKTYVPLKVQTFPDNWKPVREGFYAHEKERLNRERAFHSAEFKRYVRQQKWNDERKAIFEDEGTCFGQRVLKMRDLDEQYDIDVDTLNAGINLRQQLRNPQNREAQRAWRQWQEASGAQTKAMDHFTRNAALPKQGVENNGTRRMQAKEGPKLTDQQKKAIESLKVQWRDMHTKLQAQVDLNSKFHTYEFYEFAYDEHKLADMKDVFESELPIQSKNMLWWRMTDLYNKIKAPAKQIINNANNTRKNAQNAFNTSRGAYEQLIRQNKMFAFSC